MAAIRGIVLTSVCWLFLAWEDLDRLLERHKNRRSCWRVQEPDMLTNVLSRCAGASGRPCGTARRRIAAAALPRRVLGPLARPITRLEPPGAPASERACAPAAQPLPRSESYPRHGVAWR